MVERGRGGSRLKVYVVLWKERERNTKEIGSLISRGVLFCFDRNMRAVRKSVLEFRINIGLKMKLDQAARWFSVPVYFKWLTCLYST